ncbi:hypothetical protein ACI2K3_12395 [Staphylococcus cohnii]|uniref:hypothetical protein n=1 Tax=Staphylococcus cohnii TaxID=29382 RepID=UPI00385014AA
MSTNYLSSEQLSEMADELELTDIQQYRLNKFTEKKQAEIEEQKKKNPNEHLTDSERNEKREKIMSIKDDSERTNQIAQNRELFQY